MEQPEKGGLTRRRKTAGLNFAPVHQLFQQQNDFLALPAWPVCSAGDVRRGAQEAAPSWGGDGGGQRPEWPTTVSGTVLMGTRPMLPCTLVASPVKLEEGVLGSGAQGDS